MERIKTRHSLLHATHSGMQDLAVFLLRLAAGSILFMTGAGKVLGWFGGSGLRVTISRIADSNGFPHAFVYLSCFTEFLGGMLIILGLFFRPAAIAVAINMLVATTVIWHRGFLHGGADFPFLLLVVSLTLLIQGSGRISLDHWIAGKRREK